MVIAARVMREIDSDEVLISDWSPAGGVGFVRTDSKGRTRLIHHWPSIRTTAEP
jgi:hypothetical protein